MPVSLKKGGGCGAWDVWVLGAFGVSNIVLIFSVGCAIARGSCIFFVVWCGMDDVNTMEQESLLDE